MQIYKLTIRHKRNFIHALHSNGICNGNKTICVIRVELIVQINLTYIDRTTLLDIKHLTLLTYSFNIILRNIDNIRVMYQNPIIYKGRYDKSRILDVIKCSG